MDSRRTKNMGLDSNPVGRLRRCGLLVTVWAALISGGAVSSRAAMQVFVDEAPAEAVLTTTGGSVGLQTGGYYAAESGTVRTPEGALGPTVLVWRETGMVIVIEPGSELVFSKLERDREGLWRTVGYGLEVRLLAGSARFISATDTSLPAVRLLVIAGDVAQVKASERFVVSVALQEGADTKLEALVQVAEGAAQVIPTASATVAASTGTASAGTATTTAGQTVSAGEIVRVGSDGGVTTADTKSVSTLTAGPAAAGSGDAGSSAEAQAWRRVADEARQAEAEVAANPVTGALPATVDQEQAVSPSTFNPN